MSGVSHRPPCTPTPHALPSSGEAGEGDGWEAQGVARTGHTSAPSLKESQHSLQGVPSKGVWGQGWGRVEQGVQFADKNIAVNPSSHSLGSYHWGRREV